VQQAGGHRHLHCALRVVRRNGPRGVEEDALRDCGRADIQLQSPAQPVDVGPQHPHFRQLPGGRECVRRVLDVPAEPVVARRVEQQPGSTLPVLREGSGSFERRCCRAVATAALGPHGHAAQCVRCVRIGSVDARRKVPGPAVRVADVRQCRGERAMCGPPLAPGRSLIGRGSNQRVYDLDGVTAADDESGELCLDQRLPARADGEGSVLYHAESAGVVRSGDEQRALPGLRQPPDAVEEAALDRLRQGQPVRQRIGTDELAGRERRRELDQGQRVAAGPGDEGGHHGPR
jgi:hypothetical protein